VVRLAAEAVACSTQAWGLRWINVEESASGLRVIAPRVLTAPDGDAAGSAAPSADAHGIHNA